MKNAINARGTGIPVEGFVERILIGQRRALFDAFADFRSQAPAGSVLSVYMHAESADDDYLKAWSEDPQRALITGHAMRRRPHAGDRLRLPYADDRFDWVFCSEVIEHVGGVDRQALLLEELFRVARRGVFLTASNRHHPIEFNSRLPLLHLLPSACRRPMLRWAGKGEWAAGNALNLVDASTLYRLADGLPGAPAHDVGHKRVFGIKAHFFLMIRKG